MEHSWWKDARELDSKDFNGYLTLNNKIIETKLNNNIMRNSDYNPLRDSDTFNKMNQINKKYKTATNHLKFSTFIFFIVAISWVINLYQLIFRCEFNGIRKPEFVHIIGLFPYASPLTIFYPCTIDKYELKKH